MCLICIPNLAGMISSIIVTLSTVVKIASKAESKVEIWRFNEEVLGIHNKDRQQQGNYTLLIKPGGNGILIAQENEYVLFYSAAYALVLQRINNEALFESYWNKSARDKYYLVNLKNGTKKFIDVDLDVETTMGLSPTGRWLIYFSAQTKSFHSYETGTGIIREITKGLANRWIVHEEEMPGINLTWAPTRRTWTSKDEAVIIYDEYDIWQIDRVALRSQLILRWTSAKSIKLNLDF